MRPPEKRWYAPLLKHPEGATLFVHKLFPHATFFLEKRESTPTKMIRHVHFELGGVTILRARSEIDLSKTRPALVKILRETNLPLGIIIQKFNVRRTRVRYTSRTRAFHFIGDLHGKIWERFYTLPSSMIQVPVPRK